MCIQTGVRNRYKIAPSTTLKEVLEFYCQRHDTPAEAIVLRYQGKRLPLSESPASLGIEEGSIIGKRFVRCCVRYVSLNDEQCGGHADVETDYHRLYEESQKDADIALQSAQRQLDAERVVRTELDARITKLDKEVCCQRGVSTLLALHFTPCLHAIYSSNLRSRSAKSARSN